MRRPWRTWLILIFLILTFLVGGYRLAERQGLLVGMILAIALVSFVYIFVHDRFLNTLHAHEVEGRDPWNLLVAVEKLSRAFKIPTPRIFVIPNSTATGLALGRTWQKGRVVLSEGALNRLDEAERHMLIGYLICQIRRRDTLGLALGFALGSVVMLPGRVLDHLLTLLLNRSARPFEVFRRVLAPIGALIVRLTVGRQIYFDSDRETAQVLRDPEQLARVLWKLQSWATSDPLTVPASGAHLFIVNPLTAKNWNRYFHNQPSVARRIQLLVGRYPI